MDNLLSVGFNVDELNRQAEQVKAIVAGVYAELKKYDGMKIGPANAQSLTQLVNGIKAQQDQLTKLTGSMNELTLVMKEYNAMATKTAEINAKVAASDSDLAQANAAAKVQLQERKKLLQEQAQQNNQLYQERKKRNQQELADAQYEADFKKLVAEEEKKQKKELSDAEREYQKENRRLLNEENRLRNEANAERRRQIQQTFKEEQRTQNQTNKNNEIAGKNALKLNDLYAQMQSKKKDLETRLVNATRFNPAAVKGLETQLQVVNAEIRQMDRMLERAGSTGLMNMSRGLSDVFSHVRNLAYILPGLGIAGIFNLAFEAIAKLVEEMGLFNDEFDKTIEKQTKMNDLLEKQNALLTDSADLWKLRGEEGIDYWDRMIEVARAGGANFEQLMQLTDQANQARRRSAQDYLTDLKVESGEEAKLNTDLMALLEQRDRLLRNIGITEEEISKTKVDISSPIAGVPGVGTFVGAYELLSKAGQKAGLKDLAEDLGKQMEVFEKQYKTGFDRLKNIYSARKELSQADAQILATDAANSKYFSDEARKKILSNVEATTAAIIEAGKKVLQNELSTRQERLDAINATNAAEKTAALAHLNDVINTIGVTGSEIVKATNDYNTKILQSDTQAVEKRRNVNMDYWKWNLEVTHQINQIKTTMELLGDKERMDNEQESYDKRIQALTEYIEDRERLAYEQMQKDLTYAKETLPADKYVLEAQKIMLQYQKQVADIYNGVRKEAYDIAMSWYKKQHDLLEGELNKEQITLQDSATKELTSLNEQFAKREISYRRFAKTRAHIEETSNKEINAARVKDAQDELSRLITFRENARSKLLDAKKSFDAATNEAEKKKAQGEIDAATEQIEKTGQTITAKQGEISNLRLKNAQDKIKIEEDMIKQRNANYMQLEKELVAGIQQIVDQGFEMRLQRLQELTEAQNKAADNEIAAIERSTLSQKDKNAYEIQLNAQKTARDEQMARNEKKIKHDQAVFDKSIAVAEIITNTAIAITGALANAKELGPAAIGLAISYGALGAVQLATTLATQIPAYAEGGFHKKEGLAIFGEAGKELVKEPNKKPYIADRPTLAHLPAGTELLPLYDIPHFSENRNDGWAQTLYLGRQIQKSKREIKNVFKPKIYINTNLESYKNRILNG